MAMARVLLRAPFGLRNMTARSAPPSFSRPAPWLCWRRYPTPAHQVRSNHTTTAQAESPESPIDFDSNIMELNDKLAEKRNIKGLFFGKDSIKFKLESTGGSESHELSYIWLRDGCKCPQCVDRHSKQRNFRSSDIPLDITPKSFGWDGTTLTLNWNKDIPGFKANHVTKYDAEELKYPFERQWYSWSATGPERRRMLWNAEKMQESQHWISYEEYMHDDEKFAVAMRNLSTFGLIFVKGIPDSREMVEKIATRMGPLRNSFYGSTWDVRTIPEAKNVAYTNKYLGFHMDLMYMKDPPGFQLLHCLRNSCDGGESLFADAFRAAVLIQKHDPQLFEDLKNTHITYEYQHKDQSYQNIWPVFETSPFVSPYNTVTHVNYSPPFQGVRIPRPGTKPSVKREQEELKALETFARRLEHKPNIFELKLKPGQCVIFENRRVVHARRQFNTNRGERWLAGAYVDEDAVLSRFQVCKETYPQAWRSASRRKPYWDTSAAEPPNPETSEGLADLMRQLLKKDAKK
ncbi:hypothetical protein BJX68DRAFT_123063 [Aspergillus pseudodeflectus]|uniref:Gamma-butyrobetaine hydroxylase subfamily n=1 Tax=Aspergillus pseudodeflectus TaxID=176178 RepID=A0ABR4K3G1_9EURO